MSNSHIGSSFDGFFKEEGIYEVVSTIAIKYVLAEQLQQSMTEQGISKTMLAKRMQTSRTQIDRVLDPTNTQVQLDTLQRAAHVLGRTLTIELL